MALVPQRQVATFNVPVTADTYATEVITLTRGTFAKTADGLSDLSVLIHTLPASASIELDLLKIGGNPATAGDWYLGAQSFLAVGLQAMVQIASWPGARLRAKSGGTAGTSVVSISAD